MVYGRFYRRRRFRPRYRRRIGIKRRRPVFRKRRVFRRKQSGRIRQYRKALGAGKWKIHFPSRILRKLNYDRSGLTIGLGGLARGYYIFRGNSCYDPDYTGTGSQPYGWDELTLIYNRYKVVASQIEIIQTGEIADGEYMLTIVPYKTNNLNPDDIEDVKQYPLAKQFRINNMQTIQPKFKHYCTNKQMRRLYFGDWTESTLWSGTGTSPIDQWYWNVYVHTADKSTSNEPFPFRVKLSYYIIFQNPKGFDES